MLRICEYYRKESNLDLSNLNISDYPLENIQEILLFLDKYQIMSLNLSGNHLGDQGAEILAKSSTLKFLNLTNNLVGEVGAEALASNHTITHLNLRNNIIGDEWVKPFIINSSITSLDLSDNLIKAKEALELANSNQTLMYLNIHHYDMDSKIEKAIAKKMEENRNRKKYLDEQNNILLSTFPNVLCNIIQQYTGKQVPITNSFINRINLFSNRFKKVDINEDDKYPDNNKKCILM